MEDQTSDTELQTVESDIPRINRNFTIYSVILPEQNVIYNLAQSCIRVLARAYGPDPFPYVAEDPDRLQLHYDTLDVDMPLQQCYHVESERFWTRVVWAKHPDKSLATRRHVEWKNLGVSLKFVDLIEAASPEYWPEEEMRDLALNAQEYVKEMHIKRLRSLPERAFEKYYRPPESSDDDESISIGTESSVTTSEEEEEEDVFAAADVVKTDSELALEEERLKQKLIRKQARQLLREDKHNARMERIAKLQRREARRAKLDPSLAPPKKKRKRNVKSIWEIELSEDEEDEDREILDWRNKELYLNHLKTFDYPAEYCHHVDLSFVQHLKYLEIFTLEFQGPKMARNYHRRHFKFSNDDMRHLANGISHLPVLRVFRLRNSLMDEEKLRTIIRGLSQLPLLETVDFGFDHLGDDTGSAFYELFEVTTTIKSLILESNQLGIDVMRSLGNTLQEYQGRGCLERLDLSRNPITDEALHSFVADIKDTCHISSLGLTGCSGLGQYSLECCIAQELLSEHPPLRELFVGAIPFGPEAINKTVKALDLNKKILKFEYIGCFMDEESEFDIAVILKRNKYIAENPYVGDETYTNEDIDAWHNRTKNSILLEVYAERAGLSECPTTRFAAFMPDPEPVSLPPSYESLLSDEEMSTEMSETEFSESKPVERKPKEIKVKPKLQLYIERPYVDPEKDNVHLKNFKEKFSVWYQLKNISLGE